MTNDEELYVIDDVSVQYEYYLNNTAEHNTERNLMIAIMLRAVIDFLSPKNKKWAGDARQWIFDDNSDKNYLFSFKNICKFLDIDAGSFKKDLMQIHLKPYKAKKIQKLLHFGPTTGIRKLKADHV